MTEAKSNKADSGRPLLQFYSILADRPGFAYICCLLRRPANKMRKIKVVSKKYDGSLRDEYETYLFAETAETITLFSTPGLKYFDHRKSAWFEAPDGLIEIYFKDKWYNIWHICEQNSYTNLIYINITMPAVFQSTVLTWVDLYLDYRVHMDKTVERLDQDEFEENRQRLGYPVDLLAQVRLACLEVEAGLAAGDFPFDYERQVERYRQLKAALSVG
jgi:protein associated with RNAse G/E